MSTQRADLAVTLSERMTTALAVGDVALCERLLADYDGLIAEEALELATTAAEYAQKYVARNAGRGR